MAKYAAQCILALAALGMVGCTGLSRPEMTLRDGGNLIALKSLQRTLDGLDDRLDRNGDRVLVVLTLIDLAQAWATLGDNENASALLLDAAEEITRIKDIQTRSWPLKELAVGHARVGEFDNARTIALSNPSEDQRDWGLRAIARVQVQKRAGAKEVWKTLELIKKADQRKWSTVDAVRGSSALGDSVTPRQLAALASKSKSERDWLLKESAIALADADFWAQSAIVQAGIQDEKQRHWVKRPLAKAYARQGNVQAALKLVADIDKPGDRVWAAWDVAGSLPSWIANDSLQTCLDAVTKHAMAAGDVEHRQTVLELIGRMYAARDLKEKAKAIAQKIEESAAKQGRKAGLLRAIRVYRMAGDLESANRVLKRIQSAMRSIRGRGRRGRDSLLLLDAYVAMGKYNEAQAHITARNIHPSIQIFAWTSIFMGRLQDGQLHEALSLASHLRTHSGRSSILRPLGQELVKRADMAGVRKLAPLMTAKERDDLFANLVISLVSAGRLQDATECLPKIIDRAASSKAMAALAVGRWDAKDTSKAMELLAAIPSQDLRIQTARDIFQRVAEQGPEAAIKWLESTAVAKLRLEMLRGSSQAISAAKLKALN